MFNYIINHKYICFFILFIGSLNIYILAPNKYEYGFNVLCVLFYLLLVCLFFVCKQKRNYMDFDTLFIISYFFVMLFYPVFVYPYDPTRYFAFKYAYNEDLISQSSALSLLGIVSYMCGSILWDESYLMKKVIRKNKPTHIIFLLSIISLSLYIALGGYSDLINTYSGEEKTGSSTASYFFILSYISIFCMIIMWFNNFYNSVTTRFKWKYIPKIQCFYIFLFLFLMLYSGSRGKVINVLLICFGLYAYLFKSFSLKIVLLLAAIGMMGMCLIGIYRSGNGDESKNIADIVMDLIVCNRNNYVAIEYANEHGYSYGQSFLSYILSVIPFSQQIIYTIFNINPINGSSALIITNETLGDTSSLGMGTTIIADLYLSFGAGGCVFFMALLGWFIGFIMYQGKNNIYALTCYGVMMAFSVYLVRAEYFYFARTLVWSLVLINILKFHPVSFKFSDLKNENSTRM